MDLLFSPAILVNPTKQDGSGGQTGVTLKTKKTMKDNASKPRSSSPFTLGHARPANLISSLFTSAFFSWQNSPTSCTKSSHQSTKHKRWTAHREGGGHAPVKYNQENIHKHAVLRKQQFRCSKRKAVKQNKAAADELVKGLMINMVIELNRQCGICGFQVGGGEKLCHVNKN